MARGKYTSTTASIAANTTTTVVTPAAGESVYVTWVGCDTSVAGTTSTAKVQSTGGAVIVALFNTTAVGHQEAYPALGQRDYPGIKLPEGVALEVVTAGGAAATETLTFTYEIK